MGSSLMVLSELVGAAMPSTVKLSTAKPSGAMAPCALPGQPLQSGAGAAAQAPTAAGA